jgi:hypothetical protein
LRRLKTVMIGYPNLIGGLFHRAFHELAERSRVAVDYAYG